jgi:hypothetical protein
MVCDRMGLLDEAIRDHLELKRRRGADPAEVAREQREALAPVPRDPGDADRADEPAADDLPATPELQMPTPPLEHTLEPELASAQPAALQAQELNEPDETAELDMRAVFNEEAGQPQSDAGFESELQQWAEPPEQERLRFEDRPADSGTSAAG